VTDETSAVILASMSTTDIKALLQVTGSCSQGLAIDAGASREELLSIFETARQLDGGGAILQLLAVHPGADDALLEELVADAEPRGEWGVLSAVATSPGASPGLLRRLTSSGNPFVRGHAVLALLSAELDHSPFERFREIYEAHRGDEEEDIALRSVLAQHPRTPEDVLKDLREDAVEVVARAAQR